MDILAKFQDNENLISDSRKSELESLAEIIKVDLDKHGFAKVNFICTHNSRRSQLAELCLFLICREREVENIQTYSGGTEGTAFNYRMVNALTNLGVDLYKMGDEKNPLYSLQYNNEDHYFFSKKFDHTFNPKNNFIAVTVCSDADKNCPFIPKASARFHLGYRDPKHSDGTDEEVLVYRDKVLEVGREMYYLYQLLIES